MTQMIRQYELIDKVLKYNEKADIALINRAYVFSMKAHGNQKRASGEPYLTHPLAVADILADLKMDEASIAVGLLHDTLEDTLTSYEELKKLFGDDVADLTEGVTKLSRVKFDDKKVEQAENFRKLLLAMSEDIRVLLVKLADRLHNMRTLDYFDDRPDKQKRISAETMEIYVPLADRIGLYTVKVELENLSFMYLEPNEYKRIEEQLKELHAEDDLIPRVLGALKEDLQKAGIKAEVAGREKTILSIFRKMERKSLTFDQLTDIVAYRIMADSTAACYEVLGHVHNVYKAIPGKFKDYISSPKQNGYQSLHTSVIGPFGNRMEIQIRTEEMHEISETGVAAHWMYKEGKINRQSQKDGKYYNWLRALVDDLQDMADPEEFLEHAKMDLFNDNVFVFTPQGDLISLPRGATPLDFAYSVHSDVGNHCQTAKINGNIVQLRTALENGDQVEIVTNKGRVPSPAWRDFVVTSRARSAINRYLSNQERDEQIRLGREILEKASKRDGLKVPEKELNKVFKKVKAESSDDVYVGLAQGRIFPKQIFDVLFPKDMQEGKVEEDLESSLSSSNKSLSYTDGVEINGLIPGIAMHVAKCCSPLPGEKIVGIVTTGRGVTIHAQNCKNLEALSDQPDRWLAVSWGSEDMRNDGKSFVTRLRVIVNREPGALSSFSTAVFNAEANIVDLHIENKDSDSYAMVCDVEVNDLDHFNRMIAIVKNLKCVIDVNRIRG